MTLFDLINEDIPPREKYSSGIDFLDTPFRGGFELGQLVTITGEQEAGKTMLLNQIMGEMSENNVCLFFFLEFNKRQLQDIIKERVKKGTVKEENLKNIHLISNEMISGEINELVEKTEEYIKKHNVKIVGLDSTLMITSSGLNGEQEATDIFRKLHHTTIVSDILFFVITQGSKEDNKDGKVSIFGSQKANHLVHIMIHLFFDLKTQKREIFIAKNKQEGIHLTQEIFFQTDKLIFTETEFDLGKVTIKKKAEVKATPKQKKKKEDWNKTYDITIEENPEPTEEEKKIEDKLLKKGYDID